MRRLSGILAAAVLAVGVYGAAAAPGQTQQTQQTQQGALEAGQPAPDFELSVVGGEKVKLSDLTTKDGKTVFISFWFLN